MLFIRPHASIAAGVCVFARILRDDQSDGVSDYEQERDRERKRTGGRRPRARSRGRGVRFDLDASVLAAADPAVTEGGVSTFGTLQHLVRESGATFAPAAAVDMLSRREHSEAELRRKLSRRGFTTEAIEYTLKRMQERDYQSDLRFAQSLVRSRMSGRGVSRAALQAALAGRGVDRELTDRVIEAYYSEHPHCFHDALRAALKAVEHQEETAIIRKLARRGFDVVEIKKFLG